MSIIVSPPSREEIAVIQVRTSMSFFGSEPLILNCTLLQLKDRIYDILERKEYSNFKDDLYLLRWLKGRNLCVAIVRIYTNVYSS